MEQNVYWCDGSTWMNGQEGQDSSFLVMCPNSYIHREHIGNCSINLAELKALEWVSEVCEEGALLMTDSLLCYRWINLKLKETKGNQHLLSTIRNIRQLKDTKNLTIEFIPREQNLAGLEVEREPFYAPVWPPHYH